MEFDLIIRTSLCGNTTTNAATANGSTANGDTANGGTVNKYIPMYSQYGNVCQTLYVPRAIGHGADTTGSATASACAGAGLISNTVPIIF